MGLPRDRDTLRLHVSPRTKVCFLDGREHMLQVLGLKPALVKVSYQSLQMKVTGFTL
jgi:hypothetical protein